MNILSLFTHPHVVLNLYKFLSYVEHKEDILKSQAVFPIDFHSIYFPTVEVNGENTLFDYQHSSKYLLLCWT